MRFGGWLALGVALWAGAVAAQPEPEIVDPTPDDLTDPGFQLDWEEVLPGITLSKPTGMAFLGTKEFEEFLVLEKETGHVRHFLSRVEQPLALDLAVDRCGDRGLIGIALHPGFEPGAHVPDPDHPEKDWVYLSYHDNAGNPDGCGDTAAVFHVDRYTWNGTALVNPVSMYTRDLGAAEITAVGGVITTTEEFQLIAPVTLVTRLFILMGSLGHDGKLQNNKTGPDLDDTSVLLRLNDDGTTPLDNPFDDPDTAAPETKDRYFAYGIRDPRGVATDPVAQKVWFTEYSDTGKPDEINLLLSASNGGYKAYQGFKEPKDIPKNTEIGYPLFDLAQTSTAPKKPVSTFLLPRFSFENGAVKPTGIAFGGTEVGPQHREDVFVGTQEGNLYRFPVHSARSGFTLTGSLADTIANVADPTAIPPRPEPDDLKEIWIGKRFGVISELEEGADGSIYSVDQDGGKIYRVFFNAARDLEVVSAKVPTKISISAKKPVVSKVVRVNIVNHGDVSERIDSHQELNAFLGLEIVGVPPANCAPPAFDAVDPKYVSPPYSYPIGIKNNGGKLAIDIEVQWTCQNGPGDPAPVAGVPDFETRFHLDPTAIGVPEPVGGAEAYDNECPRAPLGDDPGCGPKGGGDAFVTDIIEK